MSIDHDAEHHDAEHQALEHSIDASRRALGAAIGAVHTDVLRHRAETREGFADVKGDIGDVQTDLEAVRIDVSGLREDLGTVKGDVAGLREDLDAVKGDVAEIKGTLAQILDRLPSRG